MQDECTQCSRCDSLESEVEALKLKAQRLTNQLAKARTALATQDQLRVCREIKRPPSVNAHLCLLNAHRDIRKALKVEPCRLLPEVGVGALVLYRCEYLRLARLIRKTDTCWLWQGGLSKTGYGMFGWSNDRWSAHRFMYTLFVRAIDYGMVIDHTCSVTACVNPEHLEQVTQGENVRRAHGIVVSQAAS